MGLFNILKNKCSINYNNVDNENLKAISSRFRGSSEDTVFVTTSKICPDCSVYNRRIFSLFGRYKSFPILPVFLHQRRCPTCGTYIGYAHYFPNINGNLKKDIAYSNRPFIDSRTVAEKKLWNERVANEAQTVKMERDFEWICSNLPDLAPKSLGGYKRMVSSNSKNYQTIVLAAKRFGRII